MSHVINLKLRNVREMTLVSLQFELATIRGLIYQSNYKKRLKRAA